MVKSFKPRSSDEPEAMGNESGKTPIGVRLLALIAGIVLIIMGIRSVGQDVIEIRKLTALSDFSATSGKWLQVSIRQDSTGASDEFYPDVLYEYFVNGKSIWGWRLSYEDQSRPKTYWDMRLKGYRKDDSVMVYVNPHDAKDVIVEKKTDGLLRPILKALVGSGFALFGFVLVLFVALGRLPPYCHESVLVDERAPNIS